MKGLALPARLDQAADVLHPFLFREFQGWLADRGGEITTMDIRQFPVPLPLYVEANLFGTFDGSTIFLHENMDDIGGAHYSTLDAMHLGFHCIQMSMPQEMAAASGLAYDKERSRREIYHSATSGTDISQMVAYEAETHSMILGYVEMLSSMLEEPLKKTGLTLQEFKDLMHDFYAADLTYVEHVLTHAELPTLSEFLGRLDKNGVERERFTDIHAMIRPVTVDHLEGTFLEKLPGGSLIFGLRGPQDSKNPTKFEPKP